MAIDFTTFDLIDGFTARMPGPVNEPFLREVLAFIELHPQRWDQGQWGARGDCGTVHCLAGWAYNLGSGDQIQVVDEDAMIGTEQPLVSTAQRLLGLTVEQARDLFFFTAVEDPDDPGGYRRPTFAELCARVEEVTGIVFKPAETLEMVA